MTWEVVAIFTTVLLAILFFVDLFHQSAKKNVDHSLWLLGVGVCALINMFLIVFALLFLCAPEQLGVTDKAWAVRLYSLCIAFSFQIFALLDAFFAHGVRDFQKTREYMELLFFVDGPAALAFFFLFAYSSIGSISGNTPINKEVLSGAVVMQMLLANVLFVIVVSNWHWWMFCRFCHNVGHSSGANSGGGHSAAMAAPNINGDGSRNSNSV